MEKEKERHMPLSGCCRRLHRRSCMPVFPNPRFLLNFEFPNTEICCSSFPPPRQLVYSSPASASFRPSSMCSILTAFLSLFPVCMSFHLSLSTFTLLTPHLPHLQAVLTTYPQACVACLCILLSSIICVRCIHIPSFSPHL